MKPRYRPIKQYFSNLIVALTFLAFVSNRIITPQLDKVSSSNELNTDGELIPLLITLGAGFLGYKWSDSLIDKIRAKNFSALKESILIWSLPISIFVFFVIVEGAIKMIQRG